MADANAPARLDLDPSALFKAVDALNKHAAWLEAEVSVLKTQLARLAIVLKSVGTAPIDANPPQGDQHG